MRSRLAVPFAVVCLLAACTDSSSPAPAATTPGTAPASSVAPAPSASDWPMYHGTPDRNGVAAAMPAAGTPTVAQSLKLD
ncbi:MAG TPA: hypothetical protein VGP57_16080, partial [Actinoplanes sp.]|nr:hypothetical protein [Actinoplanes sp.]